MTCSNGLCILGWLKSECADSLCPLVYTEKKFLFKHKSQRGVTGAKTPVWHLSFVLATVKIISFAQKQNFAQIS